MSFWPECEFQHHAMCHGCCQYPAARLNIASARQIIQQWQNITKIKVTECLHITSDGIDDCLHPTFYLSDVYADFLRYARKQDLLSGSIQVQVTSSACLV